MTATSTATGPKTAAGKAVSARTALAGPEGATTHGLFCRQTVLPHLGEDPAGYQKLLDTLHEQLRPRNLMERQYLELWADASWKTAPLLPPRSPGLGGRRAGRRRAPRPNWNASSASRPACAASSTAPCACSPRTCPNLFAHRTREDVLAKLHLTETQCAENPYREQDVERAIQANRHWPAPADDFTDGLDNDALSLPPTQNYWGPGGELLRLNRH